MKHINKWIWVGVLCALIAGTAVSCEKKGPMEKAGEKVDKVVEDAKKAVDK